MYLKFHVFQKLKLPATSLVKRFILTSIADEVHGVVVYKDENNKFTLSVADLSKANVISESSIQL